MIRRRRGAKNTEDPIKLLCRRGKKVGVRGRRRVTSRLGLGPAMSSERRQNPRRRREDRGKTKGGLPSPIFSLRLFSSKSPRPTIEEGR